MPFTALAIGAGAGLLKNYAVDVPEANRQRQLAAATQRYSPWTGNKATAPQDPNVMGSLVSGGVQGAQLGAAIQNANAQSNWLNRGGSPQYTSQLNWGNPWAQGTFGPSATPANGGWGAAFDAMPGTN